jgi:biopolymer transport protein ExbD
MKRREPLSLDLTPLIDVVFILIIFFIVSSSFKKEDFALNLTLPNSQGASRQMETKTVTIELSADKLAYNGVGIDFLELSDKLQNISDTKEAITVKIDKDVPYQKVVELLDMLQLNELNNLALVTNQ